MQRIQSGGKEENSIILKRFKLGKISNKQKFNSRRVQFSPVAQSCLNFCDPMDCNMPALAVHHHLPGPTQTHVH